MNKEQLKELIKNNIVGNEIAEKPADQFLANPLNFRQHPQKQRDLMTASLNRLGWILPVIESKRTGKLIDGHERVMQALENNQLVPYIQVDLTEDEENLALRILDEIGGLAYDDLELKQELESRIHENDKEIVEKLKEDFDYTIVQPEAGYGEKEIDENLNTEHECPSCGYKW